MKPHATRPPAAKWLLGEMQAKLVKHKRELPYVEAFLARAEIHLLANQLGHMLELEQIPDDTMGMVKLCNYLIEES